MLSELVVFRSSQKLSRLSTELARLVVISGVLNKSSISLIDSGVFFSSSANILFNDKLSGAGGFVFDIFMVVGIISAVELASLFTLSLAFSAADKKESKLISDSVAVSKIARFSGSASPAS